MINYLACPLCGAEHFCLAEPRITGLWMAQTEIDCACGFAGKWLVEGEDYPDALEQIKKAVEQVNVDE